MDDYNDVVDEHNSAISILKSAPEDVKAIDQLKTACDFGFPNSCNKLGFLFEQKLQLEESVAFFEMACDSAIDVNKVDSFAFAPSEYRQLDVRPIACNKAGVIYSEGKGVSRDTNRADKLFERACVGKNAHGCYNIGVKHENGSGTPRDINKAAEYYAMALDLDRDFQEARDALNKIEDFK